MKTEIKKISIIGLGKTGMATAKFLFDRNISFTLSDTRLEPPFLNEFKQAYPNMPLHLGGFSKLFLDEADEIIISPGLSLKEPAIAEQQTKGKKIIGDIELFLRYCDAPVCAITGSNAKSTVTALVYEMAKAATLNVKAGGNIGTPVLELLDEAETELYVLELSSFQLETTHSLRAKAATILNISYDHMDRYDSFSDYVEAKQRIYQNSETAVFNRGDKKTVNLNSDDTTDTTHSLSFGLNQADENNFGLVKEKNKIYLAKGSKKLLDTAEIYLPGQHNWENALAALALGQACGLSMDVMLKTLKTFKGLPHRCQLIHKKNNIAWYNDSKGTNEGATQAAIESIAKSIEGKIILIAGGLGKGADFFVLKEPVKKHVSHAILLGEAKHQLQEVFHDLTDVQLVETLSEAVRAAKDLSKPGDAVLFSPACSSFDMFQNFEKRGEAFEQAVLEIVT